MLVVVDFSLARRAAALGARRRAHRRREQRARRRERHCRPRGRRDCQQPGAGQGSHQRPGRDRQLSRLQEGEYDPKSFEL